MWMWRGKAPLGGPYLPDDVCMSPLMEGPSRKMVRMWNGGIPIDGELAYHVTPHPQYVGVAIVVMDT